MERSNATASDISRYHTYLKQTVSDTLPEPEIGESINDYWKRANEELQKDKARHRADILSLEQKIREISAEKTAQIEKMSEVYAENGKALLTLSRETGFDDIGEERARMIGRGYCENEDFRKAIREYPDQNEADRVMADFLRLLQWQREKGF